MPMAKAAAAGDAPNEILYGVSESLCNLYAIKLTKSASESSSAPILLLFFLQRATMPSKKSKNRPKGMKARAAQMCVVFVGSMQ